MEININSYDHIIIAFSGGKDSMACLLNIAEMGVDKSKLELWHHDIDGEKDRLMDWPVTRAYCKAVADAFGVPIYFSWKEGGFLREMLRENQRTAANTFETPDGTVTIGGDKGKESTRRKFPQVSADLSVRWCSAYLKIDVCSMAIRNQDRFKGKRVLVVSGERAEESAARSKYATFEPDRADLRNGKKYQRHVDRLRPVHGWSESDVWEIIERWKVNPHPAYKLGWGRVSCMFCIFGNANQWASAQEVDLVGFERIANFEDLFGCTIDRKIGIREKASGGSAYPMKGADKMNAMMTTYDEEIFVKNWILPAGAFADSCGPT